MPEPYAKVKARQRRTPLSVRAVNSRVGEGKERPDCQVRCRRCGEWICYGTDRNGRNITLEPNMRDLHRHQL